MSNTQPTEPLPPHQNPTPQASVPVVPAEPFYKRHGLAFAISTLVLSCVILLGLFTAGAFAVANVITHVGERAISRVVPQGPGQDQPGIPGFPGKPGEGHGQGGGKGNGNGGGEGQGGKQGGGQAEGRVLLRGTIASISGSTWSIDRQKGTAIEVTVDSSTVFGTPGQKASKGDFAKGDEVIIVGTRSDGTVVASRVLKLDAFPTRPPSTPGTPSTPGS